MRLSKVARQLAELQSVLVNAGVSEQDAVLIMEYSYAHFSLNTFGGDKWIETAINYANQNRLNEIVSSAFLWSESPERGAYWREVWRKLP